MEKAKDVNVDDLSEPFPINSEYQNHNEKNLNLPLFNTLRKNSTGVCKQDLGEMSDLLMPADIEDKHFHPTFNSKNIIKINENEDYDLVIKQFDDLISELSSKSTTQENTLNNVDGLFDIVQELNKSSIDVDNIESGSNPEQILSKELGYNEKLLTGNYPHTVKCDPSRSTLEIVDKTKTVLEKAHNQIDYKYLTDHSMKDISVSVVDKNILWINSNLWHLEDDKNVYKIQKPTSGKRKEYIPIATQFTDCNASVSSPLKSTNPCVQNSTRNQTNLYSSSDMTDQSGKYPCSKNNPKNYRSLPSVQFLRGKTANPGLWSHNALVKSPKLNRHPMLKYTSDNCFMVNLFIETKNSHLGPFTFEIYSKMTVRLLKLKVEQEYGIPVSSQRWILGKYFAVDNDKSLIEYNVLPGSAIILYVDSNCGLASNISKRVKSTECQADTHKVKEMSIVNRALETETSNIILKNLEIESIENEVRSMDGDYSFLKICDVHMKTDHLHHSASKEVHGYNFLDSHSKQESVVKSSAVENKDIKKDSPSKKKSKVKLVEKQAMLKYDDMEFFLMESKTATSDKKNYVYSNVRTDDLFEKQTNRYNILPDLADNISREKSKISDQKMLHIQEFSQSENILQGNSEIAVKDNTLFNQVQVMPANDSMNNYFSCKDSRDINLNECSENYISIDIQKEQKSMEQNPSHCSYFSVGNKETENIFHADYQSKNEDTVKYHNMSECSAESTKIRKDSENQIQSDLNLMQKTEKLDKLDNNIQANHIHSATNSKRSVTSLLRRLSLIRKTNSADDSSNNSSHTNLDMVLNEKEKNENGSAYSIQEPGCSQELNTKNFSATSESCNNADGSFIKVLNNISEKNDPLIFNHNFSLQRAHTELRASSCSQDKTHVTKKCENNPDNCTLSSEYSILEKVHTKVVDESSSLDDMSFVTVQSDEKIDGKDYHSASDAYQSSFSDVNIEISVDPEVIPTGNEAVDFTKETQEYTAVPDPDTVKNLELLLEIENMDLVENTVNFTCPVCFEEFESGQGVVLHDCFHTFCRDCLASSVIHTEGALVKCPYLDEFYSCQSYLQQREIKALVSGDEYEKYLQRSIITAEGLAERSFHCKTPDCSGWCMYDNIINIFHCPVCNHFNCLNCQAIHEGLNCRQYQEKLKMQQKVDQDAEKTLQFLNKMIETGKALRCPKCDLILMKKWGCDWLKCSVCKTEICWITRGPRWGPGGQGDTSGGCRCGVNGIKCHPSCTYCH